jgi:hypothetical protein
MNQTTQAPRYEFLDWLRVLAILLLLFFHTGMLFVGWGWHITNAETIPALELPMDLAHRLRMPLLFVIAGAGMWFGLQRRSGAAFAVPGDAPGLSVRLRDAVPTARERARGERLVRPRTTLRSEASRHPGRPRPPRGSGGGRGPKPC